MDKYSLKETLCSVSSTDISDAILLAFSSVANNKAYRYFNLRNKEMETWSTKNTKQLILKMIFLVKRGSSERQ